MHWKLAALNLFRNKARTFLTLSAISFGCAALIVAGGFMQDSVTQMKENYIRAFLGHIRVVRKGYFEKGLLEPYAHMISDASTLKERLLKVPGVIGVSPRLEFPGLLSTGDTTLPFLSQAVEPEMEQRMSLNFRMLQGSNLSIDDHYQLIIGRGLAEALGAKPGDQLTILVNTAHGGMNAMDMTVKGIFNTISKEFDDHYIRVTLPDGQKLMRTDQVQTMTLFLQNTDDTDRICENLRALFKQENLDLDVKPWHALPDADFVNKLVPFYDVFFGVLKFVIVMMVIFGIFNTINTSVLERIGEIGTLGALGSSRREILRLFIMEGFLLGLAGGILGVTSGVVVSKCISLMGIPMPIAPGTTMRWISHIELVPRACFSAGLLVVVSSLLSTCYPAWKAARLDIAEALRHNV
jgi:putative ABC transport system permease protein